MLGTRYSTKDGKAASEDFQKVSEVLCESPLDSSCVHPFFLNLSDSFSFVLRPFVFHFCSLASTITHGLPLLHFGSRMNFCTRQSPPGQTSTTWRLVRLSLGSRTIFSRVDHLLDPGWISTTCLVVWGRDHRNRNHAIKVTDIYIQTQGDHTVRLVASH